MKTQWNIFFFFLNTVFSCTLRLKNYQIYNKTLIKKTNSNNTKQYQNDSPFTDTQKLIFPIKIPIHTNTYIHTYTRSSTAHLSHLLVLRIFLLSLSVYHTSSLQQLFSSSSLTLHRSTTAGEPQHPEHTTFTHQLILHFFFFFLLSQFQFRR